MLLRFGVYTCAFLAFLPAIVLGGDRSSVSSAISATATVAEPVGIVAVNELPRPAESSPLAGPLEFLLVSPPGSILLLNGAPISLPGGASRSQLLSRIDLRSLASRRGGDEIVLTLIYAEN